MDSIEKKVEAVEEKINDRSLAMEILQELKESGRRWQRAFFATLILLALTIAGFLWFISQYDYTTSYEATGAYAIIDSTGTVIGGDYSADEIQKMLEAALDASKAAEEG